MNVELDDVNAEYQSKLQSKSCGEQAMFTLCWTIDELKVLVDCSRHLLVDLKVVLDLFQQEVRMTYLVLIFQGVCVP